MKKLKLFIALFAMLALNVGNAWAETTISFGYSNWDGVTANFSGTAKDEVTQTVDGVKVTYTRNGSSLYANTSAIRFYKSNTLKFDAPTGYSIQSIAFSCTSYQTDITSNVGTCTATSSNFSWSGDATSVTFTRPSSASSYATITGATVTLLATGGSENPGEGGGEEPTPGTGGEALSYTWDLTTNSYSAASTDQVTWSSTDVNMVVDKDNSTTNANNYLPTTRTSSRFYKNSILTITPEANVTITSVVFTATSTNYATALKGSTWTNANASANNTTVTVTPTDGTTAISAIIGGTCGFEGVTVNYTKAASDEPEPVIVKTLKSIAVTGMTTTFEQGDVFKFDGTCTATYSVTKDGAAQDDETAEVTPTNVSTPDMNQIGTQTVYVTYSEGGVEKNDDYEITITENTVTAGYYCIAPKNDFWGTNFNGALSGDALKQTYTGRQDDITIQYAKGSGSNLYINDSQTRTYSGTTLTFSVPSGYLITAIAFTAEGNNWAGTHTANVGSMTDSKNWAGSANEVTITFGGTCRITEICVTYEAIDLTLPSAPTFNPEAGTYNTVQNVTISAEAGTTIYYTLDGTDPTTASDVYASAIEISETTTVKAIAVKDEKVSPIASAKYTINLPLTTMDQIFAKATAVGSTATSVEITFGNWVVSAVKEDGKTAFVTDGIKGFVIYEASCGFNVGDVLSGTAACKVLLYNGFAELTGLTSSTTGLTVSTGGTITTQELDATAIEALTGVNTGSLIKINGICSSSDSKYYVAGVQIYTALYDFGTLNVGAEYNITGIYQPYNTTKEILPRSAEDIEKKEGLPTATIEVSNITMEVGQEKAIEATITPDAAQSTVQYAITSGNEYITLDGTTITAIAAGTATIIATIAEKADEYKGATKEFTVTVKPQNIAELPFEFTGGKADIENTLGISQEGLGTDYSGTTNLRFDDTGDCVIIHFNGQAEKLAYDIKGNSFSNGTFTVQQSADGSAYTDVVTYTELGNAATKEHELAAESRYVKFIYTEKVNGNVGLGNITISKPDSRQDAGLAWNPTSVTLTQGDAFTAPTLNNPNYVSDISYESSNDEVASVTTEGVIALATGIGTATITATFAGDATYKPATATCTITVNEYIETIDGEWQLVTDASKLQAGMEIIIASVEVDGKYYTMSKASDNGNNRTAVESTISGDKLNPALGTSVLTLVDAGNGTFALQAGNGKYLYAASSTSNHLKETATINDNAKWSVSVTEGKASVVAQGSYTRNIIRFNKSNNPKIFSCYASGQTDIALYAKVPEHSRSTSAGRYGTICLPGNIVKCLGATLYEVAGKDGLRVVFDEVLTPEAGMPYIFLAHNAEVLFYCGDQTAAAGNHKSLYGTFSVLQDAQLDGMYMVQNNKIVKCAATGCGVAENRAYFNGSELNVLGKPDAQMPGRRRITMDTESENEATGTEDVIAPEGQTIKLIENGQFIIIRGGEKFNAQGIKF